MNIIKLNPNYKRESKYQQSSILCSIITIFGLYQFSSSFFLAKKSLPHVSSCHPDVAKTLLQDIIHLSPNNTHGLQKDGFLAQILSDDQISFSSNGCWMPRRIDAMALIVVDALRFDFAIESLPSSVGRRLAKAAADKSHTDDRTNEKGQSQLFRFVADPPTVTMQRLKGLTTGGLPTFADISGNFGGADIDEDSWVQQLYDVESSKRGRESKDDRTKIAFVGDDTWVDLFPYQFYDCHPFPSFNTRDLNTVDDGCSLHLPRLLRSFGSGGSPINSTDESVFDVIVTHFLGVDHVGHTYGPHNEHMDKKLRQMDIELDIILSKIDEAKDVCQVAFVMGDHGMTEDGNHGGGSKEETNAALFAHFSPGCGDLKSSFDISGSEIGSHSEKAFQSVNQIDLVPTISLLLGLPIPYGNLGAVIPALLPPIPRKNENDDYVGAPDTAIALALNAAQVWNYLQTYSSTASKFPQETIDDLETLLKEAADKYEEALLHDGGYDSIAYREACGLFKYFLSQAIDLGKQLWTRFDTVGMTFGIVILLTALLLGFPLNSAKRLFKESKKYRALLASVNDTDQKYKITQIAVATIFMIFHCFVLTFSNSYIINEESVTMFFLAILCALPTIHRIITSPSEKSEEKVKTRISTTFLPIFIALCSRCHSLFVSGHGLDIMLRVHGAHNAGVFFSCLLILSVMRLQFTRFKVWSERLFDFHLMMDLLCILCLASSWWEKRTKDVTRQGYLSSRLVIFICGTGLLMMITGSCLNITSRLKQLKDSTSPNGKYLSVTNKIFLISWKLLLFLITVTGPSSVASCMMLIPQAWALYIITSASERQGLQVPFVAALWRLSIRHAFFATGHACSFNRLQYSAAFVATDTFYFITAGISLFFNTFGWDILGILLLATAAKEFSQRNIWDWFCFFQILESLGSCISVSLMRRHLMVWAIFAPRFVFAAVFSLLCMTSYLFMASIALFKTKSVISAFPNH